MQREAPLPADGTEMQDAQQPQTAVDAQVKGATHAPAHSEVATREVFGRLDPDVDGKISATEASADTSPHFQAMEPEGDGYSTHNTAGPRIGTECVRTVRTQ